ncbi:MAG: flagellar biosynthesis protein FlhB [Anaerolineales bacterium]|nr:flagellar biosynthesis protein FlhB [Anaerolineales bacterium]
MSSERTEAPTPKRLHEARSEGRVARSPELNAALALFAGIYLLRFAGGKLGSAFASMVSTSLTTLPPADVNGGWYTHQLMEYGMQIVPMFGVILIGLMFTGVGVSVAQTGLYWPSKRKVFDVSRVNPLQGIKRLFSGQGLSELVKAILKLTIILWVAFNFVRPRAAELMSLVHTPLPDAIHNWLALASALAMRCASTYMLIAIIDYGYQRWQLNKSLKMSLDEIKEEHKQSEGDPLRRSRMKSEHRRLVRTRMMQNVPKADVVIVNPTHLAVALKYDAKTMSAPTVIAKGAHHVAERIVALARENSVPVIQNIPIARALYKSIDVDQTIPPDLFAAVAQILAYVYNLRGRLPSRRPLLAEQAT